MRHDFTHTYIVQSNTIETHDTHTLELSLSDGTLPTYVPGQFLTIYFPTSGTPEGKAYSLSSSPREEYIRISIKRIGEFSNHLVSLKPGDMITASLPYGYFYSESETRSLVLLAGGIGIAPFRSMIVDAVKNNSKRKIILLYSTKYAKDIVFKNELQTITSTFKNIQVKYFITRESTIPKNMISGRIDTQKILDAVPHLSDSEFLICGSISFTRDMWKNLRQLGVSEESLYTEAFFS